MTVFLTKEMILKVREIEQPEMIVLLEESLKSRFSSSEFHVFPKGDKMHSIYVEWTGPALMEEVREIVAAFRGPGWSRNEGSFQDLAWLSPDGTVSHACRMKREGSSLIGKVPKIPKKSDILVRFHARFLFLRDKERNPEIYEDA